MLTATCPLCSQDKVTVSDSKKVEGAKDFDVHRIQISNYTSPRCDMSQEVVPGTEPVEPQVSTAVKYRWRPGLNAQFNV